MCPADQSDSLACSRCIESSLKSPLVRPGSQALGLQVIRSVPRTGQCQVSVGENRGKRGDDRFSDLALASATSRRLRSKRRHPGLIGNLDQPSFRLRASTGAGTRNCCWVQLVSPAARPHMQNACSTASTPCAAQQEAAEGMQQPGQQVSGQPIGTSVAASTDAQPALGQGEVVVVPL